MKIFYSKKTGGFYPDELKSDYEIAGSWPSDAVELSELEQETYWKQNPPTGKKLGSDLNGRPIWEDIPPLPLADAIKIKSSEINTKAQQFVDEKIPAYPEFAMQTFKSQEEEAIAYLADNNAPTPTLASIASKRGLTVLEIANRVIAKANAFKAIAGDIEGQRQAYEDQLEAALDVAAVEAIVVNYVLPA
ncbi:tail fiber assembly protein [Thiomicrorhabdus sp.]|uniref:tail fiber assembly protein n=1 Tax=Thiomicrorhabdus sp. TaxID=2039724 RepID=UPI003563151A